MSAEQNKALNRRLVEQGFSTGNLAVIEELVAVNCLDHGAPPGAPNGLPGVKQFVAMFRGAFPDLRYDIQDQVAEGDKVVTRTVWHGTHQGPFLGIPPTGKQVAVAGMDMTRWQDGKAVEHWSNQDTLSLLQQLDVIPPTGQAM
jgi:steroid delta-isomerase-like uncharacterized protein